MRIHVGKKILQFWGLLISIVLVSLAYRALSIPPESDWIDYTLTLTPYASEVIPEMLETEPWRLWLPWDQGTGGRIRWNPTKSLPVYFLSTILSPQALYLVLTSIMVIALYVAGYTATKSLRFAGALGIIATFSTFLNYSFVYGSLARNYLMIAYAALAAAMLVQYLKASPSKENLWLIGFIVVMPLLILAGEFWINLVIPVLISFGYVFAWAKHQNQVQLGNRIQRVSIALTGMVIAYFAFRMQFASSSFESGFENEVVFTYSSWLLMIEDMVVNYMTYVHMTLSSVLPGFLTFSPSYTHLGPELILEEQHGYHQQFASHVVSSHLTSWRFVAGFMFAGALAAGWHWVKAAWKSTDGKKLVSVVLLIIVLTGFAGYIPIKMRPFLLTGVFHYKVLMSATALMVLLAWLIHESATWKVRNYQRQAFVAIVLGSVLLAGFTRPTTYRPALEAVGLNYRGDPVVNFENWVRE